MNAAVMQAASKSHLKEAQIQELVLIKAKWDMHHSFDSLFSGKNKNKTAGFGQNTIIHYRIVHQLADAEVCRKKCRHHQFLGCV